MPSVKKGVVTLWPWTATATLRFCGINCYINQLQSLDATLHSFKAMYHHKLHANLLPFFNFRMLSWWTFLLEVQTWIPFSICGIKCLSGLQTWTTHLPILLNLGRLIPQTVMLGGIPPTQHSTWFSWLKPGHRKLPCWIRLRLRLGTNNQ